MSKLLSPDNPLMQEISKATDYIIAKFLFIVFSIPIFTIGASACAEYAVIMKIRRREDPSVVLEGFQVQFQAGFHNMGDTLSDHGFSCDRLVPSLYQR